MAKIYKIKKIPESVTQSDIIWENANKAEIDCYPWDTNGYTPNTEAFVVYNSKGLYVRQISYEDEILARSVNMNDPVYRESCMEFFLMACPDNDRRYLNFEFNPLGTINLGIGEDRNHHSPITDINPSIFNIRTSVTKESLKHYSGPCWSIRYCIPVDFLEKIFGGINLRSGMKMNGNFYKCAEDTELPHFGCWNEIVSDKPDFHRPECFGHLILD